MTFSLDIARMPRRAAARTVRAAAFGVALVVAIAVPRQSLAQTPIAAIQENAAALVGVEVTVEGQIYIPTKYNAATLTAGQSIPQPITRYAEAQLVLAEAQGGTSAVNIINTMRAAVSLTPYTGPTDAASIKTLIASERQRVLFLEGYRAFDIERLNLPLVPAVGSPYLQGGVYGGTVCFPVPDIEKNNNP